MATVKGEGFEGFGEALKRWYKESSDKIDNAIVETAVDVATKGQNITQYNIETRGTSKSGKRGRVETGLMRDSVTSKATRLNSSSARAEFGWMNVKEDYFKFQEQGFNHRGGVYVDGMYALADAADEVLSDLVEDLKRKIDGI